MRPLTISDNEKAPGIPPWMVPLYQTYKSGTADLLDFLWKTSVKNSEESRPPRLPVRRILELAKEIAAQGSNIPGHVRRIFNVVLVNRRKITNYYESVQKQSQRMAIEATKRHAFFNETLAEAYDLLFRSSPPLSRRAAKKAKAAARITGESKPDPTPGLKNYFTTTNRFDVLSEKIEMEEPPTDFALPASEAEDQDTVQMSAFEDDPLETAMSLHLLLLEIESVIQHAKNAWENCALGGNPLPLVGWMTGFAHEIIRQVADTKDAQFGGFDELRRAYLIPQAERVLPFGTADSPLHTEERDYKFAELTQSEGLIWPPKVLARIFNEQKVVDPVYISSCSNNQPLVGYYSSDDDARASYLYEHFHNGGLRTAWIMQDYEYIHGVVNELREIDDRKWTEFVQALIRDLIEVDQTGGQSLQRSHTIPLLHEVIGLLSNPERGVPTSLIFGIHLFLETGGSFLGAHKDMMEAEDLQVRAQRFAWHVSSILEQGYYLVKYDRAYEGLFSSETMEEWLTRILVLNDFISVARKDLYRQSPWGAGSHVSAILGTVQHFGLELLNQHGIFGCVLHLYNMLRHINIGCPELPALEQLCDRFEKQIFLDNKRPTSNFMTFMSVFLGYHPRSKKSQRIEAFSEQARIKGEEMCLFTHQSSDEGVCTELIWNRIADELVDMHEGEKKPKIRRGSDLKHRIVQQFPLGKVLDAAERVMSKEFSGELPIATLNTFIVLELCLKTWACIAKCVEASSTLAAKAKCWIYPSESKRKPGIADFPSGSIKLSTALFNSVLYDIETNKSIGGEIEETEALSTMKGCLVSIWGGTKPEDLVWDWTK